MKKRIGLNLDSKVVKAIKDKLENQRLYSRAINNFIVNEYNLPEVIEDNEPQNEIYQLIQFDEVSLNLIDKWKNEKNVSRSALMRDVLRKLEKALKQNKLIVHTKNKKSSFYFEKGTKEILDGLITHGDRNTTIEQYILNHYKPSENKEQLKQTPTEVESISIRMSEMAFKKLEKHVRDINESKIQKAAIMRDVVNQLIHKISQSDAHKIILDQRLQKTIEEYEKNYGQDKVKEKLKNFIEEGGENERLGH